MTSYKVGQVSALLNKGARNKKFEKVFDLSTEKPFAEFLKKKDADQGPGELIKKSKKKSVKSQNSLVIPETSMSEFVNNSSPRLVIKCKQKKRKFENVGIVNATPDQCSKKQKKFPSVLALAVEEPSESGAINEEKVKEKAANKKKNRRKVKVLSNPKEVNIESCVVSKILQDSPLKKGKKKLRVKSGQKSHGKFVESQSYVTLRKVSEDSLDDDIPDLEDKQQSEDEDLSEERPEGDSDFISVPKTKDNHEKLRRTVFVGNLPTSVNRDQLRILFKQFGQIESVRIRSAIPPKVTMSKKVANIRGEYHKNCYSLTGFVVFVKKEYAEEALSLNGSIVKNHHIRVDLASNDKMHFSEHSVFVGNLPFNINEDMMWSAFSECGTVKSIRLIRDRETGVGKGYGFVEFGEKDAVSEAFKLNETLVFGRNIRVKIIENAGKCKNEKSPNPPKKKWNYKKMASPFGKKSRKKEIKQRRNLKMKKKTAIMFSK